MCACNHSVMCACNHSVMCACNESVVCACNNSVVCACNHSVVCACNHSVVCACNGVCACNHSLFVSVTCVHFQYFCSHFNVSVVAVENMIFNLLLRFFSSHLLEVNASHLRKWSELLKENPWFRNSHIRSLTGCPLLKTRLAAGTTWPGNTQTSSKHLLPRSCIVMSLRLLLIMARSDCCIWRQPCLRRSYFTTATGTRPWTNRPWTGPTDWARQSRSLFIGSCAKGQWTNGSWKGRKRNGVWVESCAVGPSGPWPYLVLVFWDIFRLLWEQTFTKRIGSKWLWRLHRELWKCRDGGLKPFVVSKGSRKY